MGLAPDGLVMFDEQGLVIQLLVFVVVGVEGEGEAVEDEVKEDG